MSKEISGKCFYCEEKAVFGATFPLQLSTAEATMQVCDKCYAEKEAAVRKKAGSYRIKAGILFGIVAILIIGTILTNPAGIILAIGSSIGAFYTVKSGLKKAEEIERTLVLTKNNPRKFTLLFGNDKLLKASVTDNSAENEAPKSLPNKKARRFATISLIMGLISATFSVILIEEIAFAARAVIGVVYNGAGIYLGIHSFIMSKKSNTKIYIRAILGLIFCVVYLIVMLAVPQPPR